MSVFFFLIVLVLAYRDTHTHLICYTPHYNTRNYMLTLIPPSLSVAVFAVSHYGGQLLLTYFFSGYYKGRDDWSRFTTRSKTDRISLRRSYFAFLS